MAAKQTRLALLVVVLTLIAFAGVSCNPSPPTEPADASPATMEPSPSETSASGQEADVEDVEEGWKTSPAPEMEKLPPRTLASRAEELTDLGVLRTVYFDFDKSELKETARRTLTSNAGWMRANPEFMVRIAGHCDERGTEEYNLALADRRAEAVRSYLISLGVAADRLETISYGEERPAAQGHDESAWSQNRRGEFVIRAPQDARTSSRG